MGGKESANDGKTCHIAKKTCYAFVFLAAAACVIVGLLVYYAALPDCIGPDTGTLGAQGGKPNGQGQNGSKEGGKKEKPKDVLLPTHLVPVLYKVQLVPFIIPDNFTIKGYVEISMNCTESANNVTVHIKDMVIDEDSVVLEEKGNPGVKYPIKKHQYDKEREFYIIQLGKTVKKGQQYLFKAHYVAELSDKLKGFYRSSYKNDNGDKVYLATTQFQPTDARRAFPCFDEPAIKASYEVSLGRWKNMTSISNMPIKENGVPMDGTDEYVWDHYERSVPMSTYLVAFVVSDFEFELSPPTGNNVEFKIWARGNALDQVDYAKSIGAKMLKYFEDYFQVKYPLPKQDMIAVPDFSAGAMENWGLITYRETALLFKEGVSSKSNLQRIAIVISHELAHQWFGNLVTPSWWTDLWLNEGFASYVEYLGVEAVQPQLKLLEQFVITDLQSVMRIDALESSHPISIPVKHPDEINEIFDRISYSKGASIIRMMDHFLTEETFRKGLSKYLEAFAFKAAEQDDLWWHLTAQAHEDDTLPQDVTVKTIMDTWTLQMGFPVINVNRNYDSNEATIEQKRFLAISNDNPKDKHNYQWWVPITFTQPGGDFSKTKTYSKIWLKPNEGQKTLTDLPDKDTPVIFNVQQTGYYRVNYDAKNWEMIAQKLEEDYESIHVVNRAQIIDDAFNLARGNLLEYTTAFSLTGYMANEKSYIVWKAFLSAMAYVDVMLQRTAAYGDFKKYMRTVIEPIFAQVGVEPKKSNEHLDFFLRGNVVNWACRLGMEECNEKVKDKYKLWMAQYDPDAPQANQIDVNLRKVFYCHAIANGDEAEWNFAWERYQNSNVGSEKASLLGAMSCTKETWLLNTFLNMSLTSGSGIRKQDGKTVIGSIGKNIIGRDLAFDFVRNYWKQVLEYYGGSSFGLSSVVKNVMANRNTEFEINELKQFHEQNEDSLTSAQREVRQAIEKGNNNRKWMDHNYAIISKWLKERNSRNSVRF